MAPFVWSLIWVALMMFATAASVYPYRGPAGPHPGRGRVPHPDPHIMLILIGVLLPVMLIYNGYQ